MPFYDDELVVGFAVAFGVCVYVARFLDVVECTADDRWVVP